MRGLGTDIDCAFLSCKVWDARWLPLTFEARGYNIEDIQQKWEGCRRSLACIHARLDTRSCETHKWLPTVSTARLDWMQTVSASEYTGSWLCLMSYEARLARWDCSVQTHWNTRSIRRKCPRAFGQGVVEERTGTEKQLTNKSIQLRSDWPVKSVQLRNSWSVESIQIRKRSISEVLAFLQPFYTAYWSQRLGLTCPPNACVLTHALRLWQSCIFSLGWQEVFFEGC